MTQRKYTLELIQSARLLDVKPSSTPFDPLVKLNHDDGDPIDDPSHYIALVGKLLYLTITRTYISYAAQTLSQFTQSPRAPHLKALIKVLKYLKTSPGQGLLFPSKTSLHLRACCDSDWANCSFSRRSVSGYCIFQAHVFSLGNPKSNLWSQEVPLKQNIGLWQMSHVSYHGSDVYLKILVFSSQTPLLFTVTMHQQ